MLGAGTTSLLGGSAIDAANNGGKINLTSEVEDAIGSALGAGAVAATGKVLTGLLGGAGG